ncbi:MAG: putative peptidoglycan lipid flippase [Bradyrhizobium sp.]|jgi:peptidoglycan biosynthesis protein MviN/MurJ (putative lipid II flippase)|nr:putative peptidoglycan lipid flippase [Bradyrhizobium sp.]
MLQSTRTVMLFGIAVQVAAFLRTAIIAAVLGTSLDVDAYNLGLIAPSFISTVIGSWLQMGFIGRYTTLVTTGEVSLAAAYRVRMLAVVLGLALAFASLCFLFPERIMALFMPNGQTAMIASGAAALKISGLILVPIMLGDFIALILNSHGRFFAAALAPLLNALVSILGLWLWPSLNLSALVWTLLLGSLAQCFVVIAALLRMHLSFPVRTSMAKAEVRVTLMLALPLLPAMMLGNSAAAIIQFRMAELGEGMVAIYGYASRLHNALAQVLVIGLSTVLLPHFAALWSRGEKEEIVVLFRRLARCTILVVAYLVVGIYLMGETATRILFERGVFDAKHAEQVSWFWVLLSLSLFPLAFGTFIAKFCQALRGGGSILVSGIISFSATWLVTSFGATLGNPSIVISAAVASVVATGCFWFLWLGTRVQALPILQDIGLASFRMGLLLIPAVIVEHQFELWTQGQADLLSLFVRGSSYTLIFMSLLISTRSQLWFLAARPGDAPLPDSRQPKC